VGCKLANFTSVQSGLGQDQEGIDVNLQNNNSGCTALRLAAWSLKAVKLLLKQKDIDINLPDNDGYTPLRPAY
jgi:ankyrin repeat protein